MARRVYAGIDIGSSHVKVVIAAPGENSELPMIVLGTGTSLSRGVRHGYVTDVKEATRSIREALGRARSAAKIPVRSARLALGGISLDDFRSSGEITLTPSGGIVTEREIERVVSGIGNAGLFTEGVGTLPVFKSHIPGGKALSIRKLPVLSENFSHIFPIFHDYSRFNDQSYLNLRSRSGEVSHLNLFSKSNLNF